MQLSCGLPIFLLLFVLNLEPKFVKSLSNYIDVNVSSDYLGISKFNHLAIPRDNGTVFISAMDRLFTLSPDLKLLNNVTICTFDPENHNKILVIDYQTPQLIICGTSIKCPCSAYSFNNNSLEFVRNTSNIQEIPLGTANASTIAFINQYTGNQNSKLIVAVSDNDYFYNQSAISIRSLQPENFLHMDHENSEFFLKTSEKNYHHHYRVNYVYGFKSGKYNYFLTTQLNTTSKRSEYISKLIRVCYEGNSLSQGYTEIPIECKFNDGEFYNLVQAATVGKPNSQLATSLNISRDDDVLFAIFSKSKGTETNSNQPSDLSSLCIYSLKSINEKFTNNTMDCFKGKGNRGFGSMLSNPQCEENDESIDSNFCSSKVNMPLDGKQSINRPPVITFNAHMTAITSNLNDDHNDVFIGTNTGHLKNIVVKNLNTACELADLSIDEGSPVNSDLLFSPTNDSLYIMTEHNLAKIKIPIILENCSNFEDFNSCIQSTHNYCGWCESSNECATKCQCPKLSSWFSYDFRNDIKISMHNSDKLLINPGETLELFIRKLPPISNQLYCAFIINNKTLHTFTNYLNLPARSRISCSTPEIDKFSDISTIMDNFTSQLSIRTEHILHMASINITFSKCFSFISCDTCVSAKLECRWHSKKKCIHGSKIITDDSLIAADVESCGKIPANDETFQSSSSPSISSFWPLEGPKEGGTEITIKGTGLGPKFEDINNSIKVAGVPCTPFEGEFIPMMEIICKIEKSIFLPGLKGPVEIQINGSPIVSKQNFKFVDPKISFIIPNEGPVSGGTIVNINGENLNAGKSGIVSIGNTPCAVFERNSTVIQCITSSSEEKQADVLVEFDGNAYPAGDPFKFIKDPLRDEKGYNKEPKGILAGGVEILIRDVLLPPQNDRLSLFIYDEENVYNSSCKIKVDYENTWTCLSPLIPDMSSDSLDVKTPLKMNVLFDGILICNNVYFNIKTEPCTFFLYPNPKFYYFVNSSVQCGEENFIIIEGENINQACQKTDIIVTIGDHTCEVMSVSSTQVICRLPRLLISRLTYDSDEICDSSIEFNEITVSIGQNFTVTVPKQRFPDPKESDPKESTYTQSYTIASIIILILLIIFVIYCLITRKTVEKILKKLKKTQQKMTNLESYVAFECKDAFAELQTLRVSFSTHNSCSALPYLEYRTYILKILFPDMHNHSNILNGKAILIDKEEGIQSFRELLLNRRFLLLFVRTLEREKSFSMNDRVHVASMLMITLTQDLEYCTDILKTLLVELIEKNMRNKNHPKLLLRRTESIVEKMLSAWFSLLLYKFLKEIAGQPLFNLFIAIKKQIDRGPVDMITSQARYCLSENKLLRHKIAFFPLTVRVIISEKTAKIMELESPIDQVPVQVLDCDTISQFKEKALDAIYHEISFCRIINPLELNVKWVRDSSSEIILSDDDHSSIIEGEWRQKNTLRHYGIRDGSVLNLISDQETDLHSSAEIPVCNVNTPLLGNLNEPTSPIHRLRKKSLTDSTTTVIQSNEPHFKEWHLFKPQDLHVGQEDHNGNDKIIPEISLTRMLTVKNCLQKFVDELFATIFNQTNCIPMAIKYMFDFLDDQANLHNITDPEVVHVWKNNCLPLRFWVNLIKNPNFLFDVRKSNLVDSCLNVIAQVFMDSCSTSEHILTKDSATSKLLYAKEIPIYNEMVNKYYEDIKNMPRISSREMNEMLEKESKIFAADFDTNVSVSELFKYAMKYKESLIDALKNDEFSKQNVLVFDFDKSIQIMSNMPGFSDESWPV